MAGQDEQVGSLEWARESRLSGVCQGCDAEFYLGFVLEVVCPHCGQKHDVDHEDAPDGTPFVTLGAADG